MNRKAMEDTAARISRELNTRGVSEHAVHISTGEEKDFEVVQGSLERVSQSVESSLSLALYMDHRFSVHTFNRFDFPFLSDALEQAIRLTGFLSPDPHRSLPDPRYYRDLSDRDLKVFDSMVPGMDEGCRIDILTKMERYARGMDPRIISASATATDSWGRSLLLQSNGFTGFRQSSHCSMGCEVTARDSAGHRTEDYAFSADRFAGRLREPEELAREAASRALEKIGQRKLPSGTYDMIMENRVAVSFLRPLAAALSARSIHRKASFLAGLRDRSVGSRCLSLVDDPLVSGGLGSRLFDSEGMAAKRRVIFDAGVLKSYYADHYYGRKTGLPLTTGTPSNLILQGGGEGPEQLAAGIRKGIRVCDLVGGNVNGATGDFSFGITGTAIRDGEPAGAVNEMNISGNYREVLPALVATGNDPCSHSSWRIPSLVFEGIHFSGSR